MVGKQYISELCPHQESLTDLIEVSKFTIFGRHWCSFHISEETGHGITFLRPGSVVHTYNPSICKVALRGSGVKDHLSYVETVRPAWDSEAGCGGLCCIPALGGRVGCILEFEAILVYISSSRPARTI